MRILALETSDKTGSVAALADLNVLTEIRLPVDQRSAQSLLPAVRDLLAGVGWKVTDAELVVVTVGPGSFTGLRVGVTAAKTLAYVTGAQVIGVNTLEVIAQQAPRQPTADRGGWQLEVVIDAQRDQLYAGSFGRASDGSIGWLTQDRTATQSAGAQIVDVSAWLAALKDGTHVAGPGLTKLVDRLPARVCAVDRQFWNPTASAVGQLAFRQFQGGRRDDLWKLAPLYLRRSAAEEKWENLHPRDKQNESPG